MMEETSADTSVQEQENDSVPATSQDEGSTSTVLTSSETEMTSSDVEPDHEKIVKVEWMKLYKAAKYGEEYEDLKYISDRDLAIWIESGKSALDVAAYYGQTEVVRTILGCMRLTSDEEWTWSIMSALNWACQGSHPHVVKFLINKLNCPVLLCRNFFPCMSDERFQTLYQTGVTFSEPQVLIMLEELLPQIDWKHNAALFTAFFYGRKLSLQYLINKLNLTPEKLAETLSLPLLLIFIALGKVEEASREIDKNEDWYQSSTFTLESNSVSVEIDAFVIAAKFFCEDMMNILVVKSKQIRSEDFKADSVWKCVYTQAISVDDFSVLEWLEQNGLGEIKPGYEMDLHQQCLIKPYGKVFQCLKDRFTGLCESREMIEKMMLACFSTCYRGCTDLALYYLGLVSDAYNSEYTQYCLKVAIFSETPDIVETLLEQVEWSCDQRSGILHEALRWGLQCRPSRNKRLPSPVMVELLLNKLPRGSACECCECILFDLFFDFEEYDEAEAQFNRERALLTYSCVLDHIKIIITQFVHHGARPRLDAVRTLFTRFFTNDSPRTYFAARLLWIADWFDLSELNLDVNKYPLWFLSNYDDRDVFISHLLQSMSGNKRRTVRWDGLLVYILKPEKRRRQMKICIQECGLVIEDEMFKRLPAEIKRTEAYQDVLTLTKPSLISLLSLSRLSVLKHLRTKCTEYRRANKGEFLPLYSFTQLWCEKLNVPHMLCHYFEYCDVFHQWDYELGTKLHDDFRDTMEDVFVQFHLDRALDS